MDGAGNLADEEQVFDILIHASDYEEAFTSLTPHDQTVAEKLKNLAGNDHAPSNKCKCMVFPG